jgi:hypothetical protein
MKIHYRIFDKTWVNFSALIHQRTGKNWAFAQFGTHTRPQWVCRHWGCVNSFYFYIEVWTNLAGDNKPPFRMWQSCYAARYVDGKFRYVGTSAYNNTPVEVTWFGYPITAIKNSSVDVPMPSDWVMEHYQDFGEFLSSKNQDIERELKWVCRQIYDQFYRMDPYMGSKRPKTQIVDPKFRVYRPLKSSELALMKSQLLDQGHSMRELQAPTNIELGESTQRAVADFAYTDANTATLIRELVNIRAALTDPVRLLKSVRSPKALADLWLSLRYGIRLTVGDSLDIAHSLMRKRNRQRHCYRLRGVFRTEDQTLIRCTLYADPYTQSGFASSVNILQAWDLFPSLSNVWDIIPYSFVIDWFVRVDDFLQDIDSNVQYSTLNVFRCLYTWKKEAQLQDPSVVGLIGCVQYTRFVREARSKAYPTIPHFNGSLPSQTNVLDGAALIIQRLR